MYYHVFKLDEKKMTFRWYVDFYFIELSCLCLTVKMNWDKCLAVHMKPWFFKVKTVRAGQSGGWVLLVCRHNVEQTKCRQTKCWTDKMHVERQNTEETIAKYAFDASLFRLGSTNPEQKSSLCFFFGFYTGAFCRGAFVGGLLT